MKVFIICALWLLALAFADPINNLPGYKGPQLDMTSGYINVNATTGKNMFYWHIRSQGEPDIDPLVFWFQGGPGCSGLGGLFSEHGPLRTNLNGGLDYTDLSWTNIANMVYPEAPIGVGFSYSDTTSDYNTNDLIAAQDNFAFIEGFLQAYPEYIGRDIWLSGESYAGVYVPTLSGQILDHPNSLTYAQFTGLMVGNPVFSCSSLDYNNAQFMLFYWHGLVSHTNYAAWIAAGCNQNSNSQTCNNILNTTVTQIGVIDQELKLGDNLPSLDPDNLYQDFCGGNGTLEFAAIDPNSCSSIGDRINTYLNRADVQKAINAQPTTWTECTNNINYTISGQSMIPYYRRLFNERSDVSVLVYSGDVDIATVPFGFTIACLNELKDQVHPLSVWQPWFVNEVTAGYFETFQEYVFATVKGGGHEAPQYQPLTSYHLFQSFLNNQNLTSIDQIKVKPRRNVSPKLLKQADLLRKFGLAISQH